MKFNDKKLEVDDGVYPPAEDAYLLLDAIELERADSFLEIGCGTGLISVAAAEVAKSVVAIDLELNAVRNTRRNMEINSVSGRSCVIQSDLLGALAHNARFNVIAFNPPYLPENGTVTEMDHAFVGGGAGVELTERFILQAIPHLERNGRIYIVVSSLADIERVSNFMKSQGLQVNDMAETKLFFETLRVLEGIVLEGHTDTFL
ncbi:MAG: HemK2/MTQ2 family protein methyltransferase [Candidatus Thorarchaeota archaeon]